MQIALWLHLLGVVIWVGGMFFAHVAMRPALAGLPPEQRLPVTALALRQFFRWVALSIAAILGSGVWMIVELSELGTTGGYVHAMTLIGLVMMGIFAHIVASPFRRLATAVGEAAWPRAAEAMTQVRRLVAVNLVLGLVTVTIALLGHGL